MPGARAAAGRIGDRKPTAQEFKLQHEDRRHQRLPDGLAWAKEAQSHRRTGHAAVPPGADGAMPRDRAAAEGVDALPQAAEGFVQGMFDDGTPAARAAAATIMAAEAQAKTAAIQAADLEAKRFEQMANAVRLMASNPAAASPTVRARIALAQALCTFASQDGRINPAGAEVCFDALATILADPNVNQYELEVTILITNTVLRGVARMVLGPTRADGVSWTHMIPIDKNGPSGPRVDLYSTKMHPLAIVTAPTRLSSQSRRGGCTPSLGECTATGSRRRWTRSCSGWWIRTTATRRSPPPSSRPFTRMLWTCLLTSSICWFKSSS